MAGVTEVRQMFQSLAQDIGTHRAMLDEWMDASRKNLETKSAEHKAAMLQLDDAINALRKKEKALKTELNKLNKAIDQELSAVQETEQSVKQLRDRETLLPQQLESAKRQLQIQLQSLEKANVEISQMESERRQKLESLAKGTAFYSERLALLFERFEDREGHLRFTFYRVDPRDPKREFHFDICVIDNVYSLLACEPFSLPGASSWLKELNDSNDLSAFVRVMRKGFRDVITREIASIKPAETPTQP